LGPAHLPGSVQEGAVIDLRPCDLAREARSRNVGHLAMVDFIWTPKEMPKERHIVIRNTARHISDEWRDAFTACRELKQSSGPNPGMCPQARVTTGSGLSRGCRSDHFGLRWLIVALLRQF
jgi:hypothetical protein